MIILSPISSGELAQRIASLRGAAAAVVYSFAGAKEFRKIWYDQWRSAVISSYGSALEELGLNPYFVDVRSFALQALDGSLPTVICSFNLNAGVTPIHHWGIVPSVAAWAEIKPFPADVDVLIVGERKDTAAFLAQSAGLKVARTFAFNELAQVAPELPIILKPRDMGGSVGVRRTQASEVVDDTVSLSPGTIIQEFIKGYDLTVPIVWQPTKGKHRAPAGILYIPDDGTDGTDGSWFHSEESKRRGTGYQKLVVEIPADAEEAISRFAEHAELGPYARVDFRLPVSSVETRQSNPTISADTMKFIEVNPLPTLRSGINFLNAVAGNRFQSEFETEIDSLSSLLGRQPSEHALVLACALATLEGVTPRATHDEI